MPMRFRCLLTRRPPAPGGPGARTDRSRRGPSFPVDDLAAVERMTAPVTKDQIRLSSSAIAARRRSEVRSTVMLEADDHLRTGRSEAAATLPGWLP